MDLRGLEPLLPPCEDSILPLEDRPIGGPDGNRTHLKVIDSHPTSPDVPRTKTRANDVSAKRTNDWWNRRESNPRRRLAEPAFSRLNYGPIVGVAGLAPATTRSRSAPSSIEIHPVKLGRGAGRNRTFVAGMSDQHSAVELQLHRGRRGTRTPDTLRCTRVAVALLVQPDSFQTQRGERESNPQVATRAIARFSRPAPSPHRFVPPEMMPTKTPHLVDGRDQGASRPGRGTPSPATPAATRSFAASHEAASASSLSISPVQ